LSEDIERVLMVLAERSSLQDGVSMAYLANRLDVDQRRILKVIELLDKAGYVRIQQMDRVTLVGLSLEGFEAVAALRQNGQRTSGVVPVLAKVAGIGGLTILIVALGWWLWQQVPHASGAQPTAKPVALLNPVVLPTATAVPLPTRTHVATPTTASTDTPLPVPETPTPTSDLPEPLPTAIPVDEPAAGVGIPTPMPLLEQSAETVNIVLLGTDVTEGNWRTDTIIVVSVDPHLPSVSMLSIPRDLYVYIPGWQMSRINTADYHGMRVGYPGGGPGLVKATIEYNLGIRVHYYARADFQGFVDIVDTLGGIDVVADCELHDTFPDPAAPNGASDIDILPGVHHLEGKQALWYARSRWNTSDFDRGRRQQRVLRGTLAKIKQMDLLPKLPELWDELTQTIETDLSLETALWLAKVAGRLDADVAIKSRFIDNTVVENWMTPEGAAVLLPNASRVASLVADALAPPDTARSRQAIARVEVLNGTNWPNWAILAADRVLWEGFQVVDIAQADSMDYQQTVILDATQRDKGSPVNYLADVLRVEDSNILPGDTLRDDIDFRVVVGYDYTPCYRTYWRAVHGSASTSP
jgi:LCP family protein required for cell wall assembly